MKGLLLTLYFIICSYQADFQQEIQQFSLEDIQLTAEGQFFYDVATDTGILIQPRLDFNQITLYQKLSINKFFLVKKISMANLPHSLNLFTFVPTIQQILFPQYSMETRNYTIASISYRGNNLSKREYKTRIKQVELIEHQPLTPTIVNVFICGYDKSGSHSIQIIQMNNIGENQSFQNLIQVNTSLLKILKNLDDKENKESQQFRMKKYSLIYLSFLLEPYLKNRVNSGLYIDLFNSKVLSLIAVEQFHLNINSIAIQATKSQQDENLDNLSNKQLFQTQYKIRKYLKKIKTDYKNPLAEDKRKLNLVINTENMIQEFIKEEEEEEQFHLNYSLNNQKIILKGRKNNQDESRFEQVICLIIQENLISDNEDNRILECFSYDNSIKASLRLTPLQQLIADTSQNKVLIISPNEGGKSLVYYYDLFKLAESNSIHTFESIKSQNNCIIQNHFQNEHPNGLMINDKIILIFQEHLKFYYQCDLSISTATRQKIPSSWEQMAKDNTQVYYNNNNKYCLIVFENKQNKSINLAAIAEREELDLNHYGRKIVSIIPLFFFIGVLLFILLRWNRFQKVQGRLKAQIDSFDNIQITYLQFKLRYIKKEEYMKSRGTFYFNQTSSGYNKNGLEVYVDQFHPQKCYLVKTIKMLTFQNQDYVQEYINTHLSLYKYKGVQQIKHYCIIPEQSALVVTEIPLKTLQNQIEQQIECLEQFDDNTILKIAREVMQTLSIIESEINLSHRDIKPNSIVLDQDGKYKLTNFRPRQFNLAQNYMLVLSQGSMVYMAPQVRFQIEVQMSNINYDPEQEESQNYEIYQKESVDEENYNYMNLVKNEDEIHLYDSSKADVFSLGLTLLFATTKIGVDGLNINKDLLNQRINKLNSIPNYSELTKNLIIKMLKWEEDERPTYEELLQYLRQQ